LNTQGGYFTMSVMAPTSDNHISSNNTITRQQRNVTNTNKLCSNKYFSMYITECRKYHGSGAHNLNIDGCLVNWMVHSCANFMIS
jgi:hypothetical protein